MTRYERLGMRDEGLEMRNEGLGVKGEGLGTSSGGWGVRNEERRRRGEGEIVRGDRIYGRRIWHVFLVYEDIKKFEKKGGNRWYMV